MPGCSGCVKMVVINAVIYSRYREVIVDCYEMNVCGSGKTKEQVVKNCLDNLKTIKR